MTSTALRNSGDNPKNASPGWLRRLWRRFLAWLVEPTPFPMKTYDIDLPEGEERQRQKPKRATWDFEDDERDPLSDEP
jgi:hypothetical protein